jgi:NAD(P)-dependent dehydrogenase (short-subunit alcohol dehydrogenase family)
MPVVNEIEAREEDTQRPASMTPDRWGRIDVLANNAALDGALKRRPFTEISVEEG